MPDEFPNWRGTLELNVVLPMPNVTRNLVISQEDSLADVISVIKQLVIGNNYFTVEF